MNIEPNAQPAKLSEYQKKQLEKIFTRCFDTVSGQPPVVNQEGITLCMEAGVNPEDLLPKTLEYFKQGRTVEEVAKIRSQHHVQKRLSKLHHSNFSFYLFLCRETERHRQNHREAGNEAQTGR